MTILRQPHQTSTPDRPVEMPPAKGTRALARGRRPLGNNTKSTAGVFDQAGVTKGLYRRKRYEMLRTAQEVTQRKYRVKSCSCYVAKTPDGKVPDSVRIQKTTKSTSWKGITVCGSVWHCPVCSQKIMKERKDQVLQALKLNRQQGGRAIMETLTFSHSSRDGLKDTITKFSKVLSLMKGSRKFRKLRQSLGVFGSIRALEITHGENGWHPHTHDILFLESAVTEDQVKEYELELFELYRHYCKKYGLGLPNKKHGVRVDYRENENTDHIGSYLVKWGDELTSSHTKKGNGSRTPWDILDDLKTWNFPDSQLWKEYCEAMHGRAMLYWSKGLKDRFEIQEFTDQQIAELENDLEILDELEVKKSDWYSIVRLRKQAQVLERFDQGRDIAIDYIARVVATDRDIQRDYNRKKRRLAEGIRLSTLFAMRRMALI